MKNNIPEVLEIYAREAGFSTRIRHDSDAPLEYKQRLRKYIEELKAQTNYVACFVRPLHDSIVTQTRGLSSSELDFLRLDLSRKAQEFGYAVSLQPAYWNPSKPREGHLLLLVRPQRQEIISHINQRKR